VCYQYMNRTKLTAMCGLALGLVLSAFLGVASVNAKSDVKSGIKIERPHHGIAAKLIDRDDYYFHPSGRKIKFYRKKDVYAVRRAVDNVQNRVDSMQRFKGQFGERVRSVDQHQLGHLQVVRIDNRSAAKVAAKQNFDIKPEMLTSLDAATHSMMPIFTTEQGKADLLLLPKVTVELNSRMAEVDALAALKSKYGLALIRKLKLSDGVYSLAFTNNRIDSSLQFSQVRRIMNEPFVSWAEPQFYVKPVKEQFTPNDTLIGDQWNLIDRGFRGSRCDTDCDANNAWDIGDANGTGAVTGSGMVIAVIDDGVQLNHPDLNGNIWVNTAERDGAAGVDDDGNGYVDDINGYDFVTDDSTNTCENGQSLNDGDIGPPSDLGQDANPNPRATVNCVLPGQGEPFQEDNHGTAVAGILAAEGNNNTGIAGVAYGAEIMAIRAISEFDEAPLAANEESFCNVIAEAMEYAAQHADVINNSWSLPITCSVLDSALTRVTSGDVMTGLGSKRDGGSPVIFASGNDASGWVRVTVPVTAGEHAYEWRLLRSAFPEFHVTGDDDTVWLDDIVWSDDTTEDFESGLGNFTTRWVLNSCDDECPDGSIFRPVWDIESRPQFVRNGARSARIMAAAGPDDSYCGNSYLHTIKDGPAGEISFWVWVSTSAAADSDRFEFLIDGREVLSYGDLASFGFVDNAVAYPASSGNRISMPTGVIAVGASKSGDLSGVTSAALSSEERASYSQYGPTLDLVAPSSDQHLGITTTDRTGADGYTTGDYTSGFGGTSAAAPVVSGVAAAMLAVNPALTAAQVKSMLRASADAIGRVPYVAGRNDFHGYGRVNMYGALLLAQGSSLSSQSPSCSADAFDYSVASDLLLPRYRPQPTEFCPAIGPLPQSDEFCVPIKASNGAVAVICL